MDDMVEESDTAEFKSAEVVNAAAVHAEAIEKARLAQMKTVFDASIEDFFDRGVIKKRFIDTDRIPFICDDLRNIHLFLKSIDEHSVTKEDFLLVRNIVFGFIAIIVLAFMGALTTMVFK